MATTPGTLIAELCRPHPSAKAWERFVDLYTPLLHSVARRGRLRTHEVEDFVQDVLLLLCERLPEFHYDPKKSFRRWLRTVAYHKLCDILRIRHLSMAGNGEELNNVPCPEADDSFWDDEALRELVRRAIDMVKCEFTPRSWKAFEEFARVGRSAAEVARELGMTENAVYIVKSKVIRRVRELVGDIVF